jgi:hypothetical protein
LVGKENWSINALPREMMISFSVAIRFFSLYSLRQRQFCRRDIFLTNNFCRFFFEENSFEKKAIR